MSDSLIIQQARETFRLGMIELTSGNNEMEILAASQSGTKAPPGWTLPALAVAVAASREASKLHEMIAGLQKRVEALEGKPDFASAFDAARAARNLAPVPARSYDVPNDEPRAGGTETYVPSPEALEENYQDRLRDARALAESGAGWAKVVDFAYAGLAKGAPRRVCSNERPPTPDELTVIEEWLDRHASRKTAL